MRSLRMPASDTMRSIWLVESDSHLCPCVFCGVGCAVGGRLDRVRPGPVRPSILETTDNFRNALAVHKAGQRAVELGDGGHLAVELHLGRVRGDLARLGLLLFVLVRAIVRGRSINQN